MSGKPEKDPVADALAWLDATAPEGLPFAIARNSGVAGVTAGDVSVVLGGAGAAASGEVSLLPKLPDVPAFITEVEEATHWKLYSLFTTANSDEEGAALVREAVSIRACPNITALVDDRIMPLYDIEVSTLAPHFASLKEHLNTQFTDTMLRYESKITDLDKLRDKSISKIQEERAKYDVLVAKGADLAVIKEQEESMASAGGVVREILSIITSERAKIESAVESYKAQYESQISSLEESMSDTVLSYENTYKDLSCMRAPLHMAAKLGMVQIAKALLDSGADVNMPCMIGDQAQYNATPFAISLPYQDALKALRAAQITMLTDPKAEFADFELLQKITGTPMLLAADAVQTPMIMLLIVAGGHFTPLCATVYSRKLTEMLESMVAAGASPEEYPNPFDLLKWVVNSATKNTVAYSAPLASDKPVAYHETVAHYETLAPHKSVAFHESLIEAFDSLLSLKNVMAHLDAPEGETMFRDICLDAELSEHYVAIGGVSVAHDLAA